MPNDWQNYGHPFFVHFWKYIKNVYPNRIFFSFLQYYRNEKEEQNGTEPVGDIDVSSATFRYDVGEDNSGEFTIWWVQL